MLVLNSCAENSFNMAFKTNDYNYKYEVAKEYYAKEKYVQSSQLLDQLLLTLKGTDKGEECLFMLGLCYYNIKDYETSSVYLQRYYKSYPKGLYAEQARFYCGKSAFLQSPDARLDQSPTYDAISELQAYLEYFPYSSRKEEATDLIFQLQNRLVEKEFDAAQLYYNLGNYTGNCQHGGNNYEACIITAENALKSFPYTTLREDFMMMILRAKYRIAKNSVDEKSEERFRQTVDEYYGFRNEFPESKYMREADLIFRNSDAKLKKIEIQFNKKEAKLLEG